LCVKNVQFNGEPEKIGLSCVLHAVFHRVIHRNCG
jgi:hypothetical protein